MVSNTVKVLITAEDKASGPMKNVGESSKDLSSKVKEVGASFIIVKTAITEAVSSMHDFMDGALDTQASLDQLQVAQRLSTEEMEAYDAALVAMRETSGGAVRSQQELAAGLAEIANESHNAEENLSVLQAAVDLTAASGREFIGTTGQVEGILDAWGMSMLEASRIADILITTQRNTGAETEWVGENLARMGAILSGLGWRLEDVAALFGVLRNESQDSARGILTALSQLANSTSLLSVKFDEAGVSVRNANGDLLPLRDVLNAIGASGMGAQDALEAAGIYGAGAFAAVSSELNTILDVTDNNLASVGRAADDAALSLLTQSGQVEATRADWEDLKKELADGLMPAFTKVLDILRPLFEWIANNADVVLSLALAYISLKILSLAAAGAQLIMAAASSTLARQMLILRAQMGLAFGGLSLLIYGIIEAKPAFVALGGALLAAAAAWLVYTKAAWSAAAATAAATVGISLAIGAAAYVASREKTKTQSPEEREIDEQRKQLEAQQAQLGETTAQETTVINNYIAGDVTGVTSSRQRHSQDTEMQQAFGARGI